MGNRKISSHQFQRSSYQLLLLN